MSATEKKRLDGNYVTASNFGSSSGYIKYSNGLLIQWGVNKDSESSGTDRLIKVTGLLFTQPPMVLFSPYFTAKDNEGWFPNIMDVSTTSFTINTHRSGSDLYARWIAIGI